jgi:2'-5' RNA ligase
VTGPDDDPGPAAGGDPAPRPAGRRLFAAVWTPDDIRVRLSRIASAFQGTHEGVRWRPPRSYHVTLAFLGNVTADPRELTAVLDGLDLAPVEATVGPELELLGRGVVCAPVHGLDELATTVRASLSGFVERPDPRSFVGHITLARLPHRSGERRRRSGLGFVQEWLGTPVSARWTVDEVSLVQSVDTRTGSEYDELYCRSLRPDGWRGRHGSA